MTVSKSPIGRRGRRHQRNLDARDCELPVRRCRRRVRTARWRNLVPRAVDPSTINYSAVAFSYLPLNADILGIDPVRLPSDGRVPIYRAGDVVVILHLQTNAPATPTLNGSTGSYELSCGRTPGRLGQDYRRQRRGGDRRLHLGPRARVLSWSSISGLCNPTDRQAHRRRSAHDHRRSD